jgi:hypothetical protein
MTRMEETIVKHTFEGLATIEREGYLTRAPLMTSRSIDSYRRLLTTTANRKDQEMIAAKGLSLTLWPVLWRHQREY